MTVKWDGATMCDDGPGRGDRTMTDEPAVTFGALVAGIRVLQTGEVSIRITVPVVDAEKALALGLFMGNFFERLEWYAPSKMEQI